MSHYGDLSDKTQVMGHWEEMSPLFFNFLDYKGHASSLAGASDH